MTLSADTIEAVNYSSSNSSIVKNVSVDDSDMKKIFLINYSPISSASAEVALNGLAWK